MSHTHIDLHLFQKAVDAWKELHTTMAHNERTAITFIFIYIALQNLIRQQSSHYIGSQSAQRDPNYSQLPN